MRRARPGSEEVDGCRRATSWPRTQPRGCRRPTARPSDASTSGCHGGLDFRFDRATQLDETRPHRRRNYSSSACTAAGSSRRSPGGGARRGAGSARYPTADRITRVRKENLVREVPLGCGRGRCRARRPRPRRLSAAPSHLPARKAGRAHVFSGNASVHQAQLLSATVLNGVASDNLLTLPNVVSASTESRRPAEPA